MRAFASSDKIRFLRAFTGLGVDSTSAFGGLPLLGFAADDVGATDARKIE